MDLGGASTNPLQAVAFIKHLRYTRVSLHQMPYILDLV